MAHWIDYLIAILIVVIIIGLIMLFFMFIKKRMGLTRYRKEMVAKAPNKQRSVNLLGEIKRRIKRLINQCDTYYGDKENVRNLRERFDPNNIQETSLYDSGTSYTVDKGKELRLCLRDKKTLQHHDINTLMFVSIHELAHIMSNSYGHNEEFTRNFKFLLEQAVASGVYKAEDYERKPAKFCGIEITSSPLFW